MKRQYHSSIPQGKNSTQSSARHRQHSKCLCCPNHKQPCTGHQQGLTWIVPHRHIILTSVVEAGIFGMVPRLLWEVYNILTVKSIVSNNLASQMLKNLYGISGKVLLNKVIVWFFLICGYIYQCFPFYYIWTSFETTEYKMGATCHYWVIGRGNWSISSNLSTVRSQFQSDLPEKGFETLFWKNTNRPLSQIGS